MRAGVKSRGKKIDARDYAREVILLPSAPVKEDFEKKAAFLAALYRVFIMGGKVTVEQDGKTYSYEQPPPDFSTKAKQEPEHAGSAAGS